jgi:hypothetical protein
MPQDNIPDSQERKLEPYHYEAMIRAEVEKRLTEEKERTNTQHNVPRDYPEPQSQPLVQPNYPGWPTPGQPGGYPMAQPQQYYSGQLPAYQQPPQSYPPAYYQPQPLPYYPPPPAPAPVVNVVVQNTNVNQNINRNYTGRRYYRQGGISGANIIYFLLLGWMFGGTWAFVGLCLLPFNARSAQLVFRQAYFLAFLA